MILDVKFIFIFLGVLVIATFLYLIKKTKPKKMNLLIWNPIDDNEANFFKRFVPLNQINSYSEDESKRYNFKYFNDFYLIDYPYQEKNYKIILR